MTLEELRKQIDACDDKIAEAYNERMKLAEKIAEAKKATGARQIRRQKVKSSKRCPRMRNIPYPQLLRARE